MKTILLSSLLFVSCFIFQNSTAQSSSVTADSLSRLLAGKWESVLTCGGIAGVCRPAIGQSIEFKDLTPQSFYYEQSTINTKYHWYFMKTDTSGSVQSSPKDSLLFFPAGVFYIQPTYVDVQAQDTIWIGSDCIDCIGTKFVRSAVITAYNEEVILDASFLVGPNPFADRLILSNITPNSAVRLIDLGGKVSFELVPTSVDIHIDASSIPSGMYVLEVRNGENTVRKNVVKK